MPYVPTLREALTPRVKPEFGPTLFAYIAPLPRRVRLGIAAVAAFAALVSAALLVSSGDDEQRILVRGPATFNLAYEGALEKVSEPGALVALERRRGGLFLDSYAIRPLNLPPYRGAASGTLPLYATDYLRRLRGRYPGLELVQEGRTRVNNGIGYQVLLRARRDGRTLYVRHLLLVPEEPLGERRGVIIELETTPSATPNLAATGNFSPLKTPLRSFRFGTDRKGGEA